jgi:hypothetical protein
MLLFKLDFIRPPRCCWQRIGLGDSPNSNDRARRPTGFNIACYRNRSCHYNSIAWKTAQRCDKRWFLSSTFAVKWSEAEWQKCYLKTTG